MSGVAIDESAIGDWQTKNPVKMASLLTDLEGIFSDEQETKDAVARVTKVRVIVDSEEPSSKVLPHYTNRLRNAWGLRRHKEDVCRINQNQTK